MAAAAAIQVRYTPLSPVTTIEEALVPDPVLVHENLGSYQRMEADIYPRAGTNLFHAVKVRKGDMERGWALSEETVEGTFHLPQSDHAAMETRAVRCSISPGGVIDITTASQSPFEVRELISRYFDVPQGMVAVHVPLVGGAFGGKAAVQLEVLAVLASRAVEDVYKRQSGGCARGAGKSPGRRQEYAGGIPDAFKYPPLQGPLRPRPQEPAL